jgi:hypothetical protein
VPEDRNLDSEEDSDENVDHFEKFEKMLMQHVQEKKRVKK